MNHIQSKKGIPCESEIHAVGIRSNINGVTTASGETGQAAGQVLEAANELAQRGEQLTGKITELIGEDA